MYGLEGARKIRWNAQSASLHKGPVEGKDQAPKLLGPYRKSKML